MLRYATYGFAGLRYRCTGANGTCASLPDDVSCDAAAAAAADRWIFLCLRCTMATELAQLSSSVAAVTTVLQLSTCCAGTSFSTSERWQDAAMSVDITNIYSTGNSKKQCAARHACPRYWINIRDIKIRAHCSMLSPGKHRSFTITSSQTVWLINIFGSAMCILDRYGPRFNGTIAVPSPMYCVNSTKTAVTFPIFLLTKIQSYKQTQAIIISTSPATNKLLCCSCLSVVSFNSTIHLAQSSIICYFGFRFTAAYN